MSRLAPRRSELAGYGFGLPLTRRELRAAFAAILLEEGLPQIE